ncbi:MAG: acyl transferase [Flavobacteriaceae bacterium]|nr:acyl transferase [Flavobacteriaceae bacterium]
MPISFFKTHKVYSYHQPELMVFKSSGTTGSIRSQHYIAKPALYKKSFTLGFKNTFGAIDDYCILALLPGYYERKDASLIYMVQELMNLSGHPDNGYFLDDFKALHRRLIEKATAGEKVILFGVTHALLDFSEYFSGSIPNTIVIETGGMKGRKKEIIRKELHHQLKAALHCASVYSEYGMTELLSQAYAKDGEYFVVPAWMKISVRDLRDPMHYLEINQNGGINIIDLANLYSCPFIATDDIGRMLDKNQCAVLGRIDNSESRGCSLMYF